MTRLRRAHAGVDADEEHSHAGLDAIAKARELGVHHAAINMAQWGMRTTIDIPDAMYRRLKARAATEGRSAKTLILRGVEQVLASKSKAAPRNRLKLPIIRSKRPGTLYLDNARIYDIISFP